MAQGLGQAGNLMVVPPAALEAQLAQQAKDRASNAAQPVPDANTTQLAAYVRTQFEIFRNHRNTAAGWSERMVHALRTFNGQYDASKLQEIKKFGGSEIYTRMIAQKCRGASSLLRDVYLGSDRPWGLTPPADPDVPEEITAKIDQLLQMEAMQMAQQGQQAPPTEMADRKRQLLEGARDAARKRAADQADIAEDKIEELLREGQFYHAFAEFLVDLPTFPFACIKGPVVKIMPKVVWPKAGGQPTIQYKPRLYWYRVSPFDLWFTPGVADIENANVIEKQRITRGEINDMLDLPGYDTEAVRKVLEEYGRGGLYDNWDTTDAERAVLESRENPMWNRSNLITMMEFNGNVQGRLLQEYGLAVEDELRDYHVQVWIIGAHVVKAQLSPSPRMRHPYYITSFEKVPGTPVGNGLTDVLSDIQEGANATLRALINNLAIASGPQVVVMDDLLAPDESGEELYPWKRWHTRQDPSTSGARQPVSFFMPTSNAQELIGVLKYFSELADDISAIPKYISSGQGASSGAGRTASGLAMLMGNASKLLQTVSANIDRDVLEPALGNLFDLILLTDTSGMLSGEEEVTVQGVNVAIQRETVRQRQIEFLGATMNPLDSKIIGMKGRAAMLRSVSKTIGLPGEEIVPSEQNLEKMEKEQAQQASAQTAQQAVDKGVQAGVEAGVKRITTELTSGILGSQEQLPPGPPVHTGTPVTPGEGVHAPSAGLGAMGAAGQGGQPTKPQQGPPQTNAVTMPTGPRMPGPGPS